MFTFNHCDVYTKRLQMRHYMTPVNSLPGLLNKVSHGIIHHLFKNKGFVSDTDNYRGITLLRFTGKLVSSSCYVEDHILGQEQAGFRQSYSTIDHILFCS